MEGGSPIVRWEIEYFENKVIKYESASANLLMQPDGSAFLLNVMSKERGQGHGTKLMERICTFADQNRLRLTLSVQRFGDPHGGLDNQQLLDFYKKFGFTVTKKERRQPVEMERIPR